MYKSQTTTRHKNHGALAVTSARLPAPYYVLYRLMATTIPALTQIDMTKIPITLPSPVSFLILGAGWTSQFLRPLLTSLSIPHAATTRAGSSSTIKFTFDPLSSDLAPYHALPAADTVLITFPITLAGGTLRLLDLYNLTHPDGKEGRKWIQLGSTGLWSGEEWSDRRSAIDSENARGKEETQLLGFGGCVLNLAGLWGGERHPKNWVRRVATKEQLAEKGLLHLIHGEDVSAAVVAVHKSEDGWSGERWMLTDMRCYDWWELALSWGNSEWVMELMRDAGMRALPRGVNSRGRRLDSREFWQRFRLVPLKSLI
jgi:hypothetical protein